EIDGSVEVTFPSLLEHDVTSRVAAIVQAATLSGFQPAGTLDPATLSKLLLQALGVEDVDAALAELFPDDREPEADMLPLDPIRRRQALTMDLANKIVAPSTAAARLGYDAGEPAKAAGEKGNLGDALLAQFEKGDQGDEADPQT
ncbi:MAG: hypothetical protein ACRDGF_00520, partial [Chloroflexota bacterium]